MRVLFHAKRPISASCFTQYTRPVSRTQGEGSCVNSASYFTHPRPSGGRGYLGAIYREKDEGYRGVFARPISRTALRA
jgi:hypothetical protein